jgi:hypothetical protein
MACPAQQWYQPFANCAGCSGEKNKVRHLHFPSMNVFMICSMSEVFRKRRSKVSRMQASGRHAKSGLRQANRATYTLTGP